MANMNLADGIQKHTHTHTCSAIKDLGSALGQFQKLDIYTSESRQINEDIRSISLSNIYDDIRDSG